MYKMIERKKTVSDVCFVFASAVEKDANKVINKYLKDVDYDVKFLHSGRKKKFLRKILIWKCLNLMGTRYFVLSEQTLLSM